MPVDDLQVVFARSDDVLMTDSGDMKVLMAIDTGQFVELNHIGRAIWDLTDGENSVAHIIAALQDRYAVQEQECTAHVQAFLGELLVEKLVRRKD